MNVFNVSDSTHLVSAADVHYEPSAFMRKTDSIADRLTAPRSRLPNDTTNRPGAAAAGAGGLIT